MLISAINGRHLHFTEIMIPKVSSQQMKEIKKIALNEYGYFKNVVTLEGLNSNLPYLFTNTGQ